MAGPYLSDAAILAKVQAALNIGGLDASSNWPNIVADAHQRGYQGLLAILAERGFSQQQVDNWDRRAEFEADLSLFWAFVLGGIGADYDSQFIKMLDRREELKTMTLTTNGAQIFPAAAPPVGSNQTGPGPIGGGKLNTCRDVFQFRRPTSRHADSYDHRYDRDFPR